MKDPRWIIIPNWFGEDGEGLQHYRDRDPVWIKNYRRLLARDEYRQLSGHRRAILHGLWLEYATTDGRLRDDTRTLSHRLSLKVTTLDLESLNEAGFIDFSASKPLAISYHRASPRALAAETEKETEKQEQGAGSTNLVGLPRENGSRPEDQNGPTHIAALIDQSLREIA